MKKYLFGLSIGLLLQTSFAQDTLTVERAVQQVLKTHPALEQAAANVRAAEARTALSKSAQAPNISALAQYTRIGPIPSVMFGTENFFFAPDNNYDGHISADYTVYDFGKTGSGIDLAVEPEGELGPPESPLHAASVVRTARRTTPARICREVI